MELVSSSAILLGAEEECSSIRRFSLIVYVRCFSSNFLKIMSFYRGVFMIVNGTTTIPVRRSAVVEV